MADKKIMKATEINMDKINLSDPKKLPSGGNMIYLNYGFGPLYIQSPRVNVLWDSKYYSDNESTGKYTVQFSLSDMDNNEKMKEFHDAMVKLDKYVLDSAYENRKDWFGAKFAKSTVETLESLYTPMVKISVDQETGDPDGRFPPRFAFKVVKRDNVHQCKVYDSNKKLFNIDDNDSTDYMSLETDILVKGSSMTVLLKCNGIWVINGKFGCTWRAEQVKVKVHEKAISGYAFRDDDDDEPVKDTKPKVDKPIDDMVHNIVDDSDDSDDSSNSDVEDKEPPTTVSPTPVKKKRVVRKKA